jgi:hypothetical protein
MKCQDAEKDILSTVDRCIWTVELEAHLGQCADCSAFLEKSQEVDLLFLECRQLEPNPFLWTRINRRLTEQTSARRRFQFSLPVSGWLTVTALLIFSFFLSAPRDGLPENHQTPAVEYGLGLDSGGGNPFLMAQAGMAAAANPFLEAMTPRDLNPFQFRRVR